MKTLRREISDLTCTIGDDIGMQAIGYSQTKRQYGGTHKDKKGPGPFLNVQMQLSHTTYPNFCWKIMVRSPCALNISMLKQ